jgi:hypothetical protein
MKWFDRGSIGECTAVASAKRAVRGDLSDGGFSDERVATESPEDARGRVEITIWAGRFFSKSDMFVRWLVTMKPDVSRLCRRLSR